MPLLQQITLLRNEKKQFSACGYVSDMQKRESKCQHIRAYQLVENLQYLLQ